MAPCAWLLPLDKAWCPRVTLLCTLGRSWKVMGREETGVRQRPWLPFPFLLPYGKQQVLWAGHSMPRAARPLGSGWQ